MLDVINHCEQQTIRILKLERQIDALKNSDVAKIKEKLAKSRIENSVLTEQLNGAAELLSDSFGIIRSVDTKLSELSLFLSNGTKNGDIANPNILRVHLNNIHQITTEALSNESK